MMIGALLGDPPGAPPAVEAFAAAVIGRPLIAAYEDGRAARLLLAPNRRYWIGRPNGRDVVGKWKVRDGEVCLKQIDPISFSRSMCFRVQRLSPSSWAAENDKGRRFRLDLPGPRP